MSTLGERLFGSLWQHRGLLWHFTVRQVEIQHKGSHFGVYWSIINPLLLLGLYVFVFGFIFGGHFDVIPNETPFDYAAGIFLGLTLFHFVAEIIGLASSCITSQPNFVKKVVFPLEVLPAALVGAALFHLLFAMVLIFGLVVIFSTGLTLAAFWLPVILLPLILLGLGLSWILSSIGVFFRDLGQLTQFLSMALMFASAIFYPASRIPPVAWTYMRFNPMLLAVELSRDALLWHRPVNLAQLGYLYVVGIVVCLLGYRIFKKLMPTFADVI